VRKALYKSLRIEKWRGSRNHHAFRKFFADSLPSLPLPLKGMASWRLYVQKLSSYTGFVYGASGKNISAGILIWRKFGGSPKRWLFPGDWRQITP
jgi:hypothetical protein